MAQPRYKVATLWQSVMSTLFAIDPPEAEAPEEPRPPRPLDVAIETIRANEFPGLSTPRIRMGGYARLGITQSARLTGDGQVGQDGEWLAEVREIEGKLWRVRLEPWGG